MASLRLARRYPLVTAALLVLAGALALQAAGQTTAGSVLAGAFAGAVGLWTLVGMVREMLRGRWGLDMLAVGAIGATLAVGEEIAAVIIVLMLTGGGALEDFAAGRAKRELTALLDRAPRVAHRQADGPVEDVGLDAVRPGDLLIVRPNEVVRSTERLPRPMASSTSPR